MAPSPDRRGFTLLEVLVALAVGGLVLAAARELFGAVADVADRVPAETRLADSERNRQRLLRDLLGRVEVATDSARRFNGDVLHARFDTWCPSAGGWLERCTVDLALVTGDGATALEAAWDGRRLTMMTGAGPMGFRYLRTAANGGEWVERWGANALSAPLALLVVIGGDTLFLRVGERG